VLSEHANLSSLRPDEFTSGPTPRGKTALRGGAGFQGVLAVEYPLGVARGRNPRYHIVCTRHCVHATGFSPS